MEKPLYVLNVEDAKLHIAKGNTKLGDNIYCISTLPSDEPLSTKNGLLTDIEGTCKGVCEGCKNYCYAINLGKLHHNVCIKSWGENTLLARYNREKYFEEIKNYLTKKKVNEFRWHVSGEIIDYDYLVRMNQIALDLPLIQFGVYTKRFDLVQQFLNEYGAFAFNLAVNISVWGDNLKGYDFGDRVNYFVWCDTFEEKEKHNVKVMCPAVSKPAKNGGKGHKTNVQCSQCVRCYRNNGTTTGVWNH